MNHLMFFMLNDSQIKAIFEEKNGQALNLNFMSHAIYSIVTLCSTSC